MELPAGDAFDATVLADCEVDVVPSASSSREAAELIECVLLCRSCEKCRAIPVGPEDGKSFCVSLSWNEVVDGNVAMGWLPELCRLASDGCLDSAFELVVDDADESLNPDVAGEIGLVGAERIPVAPLLPAPALCFCAMASALCSAALFIEGLGVSSSKVVPGCSASLRLLIVGGSEPDESSGTSRTRQENTSDPSSKIEVSGKDENAMLSRSSRLMPSGG